MSRSTSLLLYQDEPAGSLLKTVMVMVPAILLLVSIYLWSSGERSGGLVLLIEAFSISAIFWIAFPRRYEVYDDHLRVVLGGPFAVKIGFDQIAAIEVTSRTALTVNFATTITKTYVRIVKKQGLSIAITPRSNGSFVDNANQALSQWARTRGVESPLRRAR